VIIGNSCKSRGALETKIEVTESTKNKLSAFSNHFDPWPELDIHYSPIEGSNKQVVVIEATPFQ
jgi:hypothetical protein